MSDITDAGNLNLDARQRAMLDEMGVKVWWPAPAAAASSPTPAVPDPVAARQGRAPATPAPATPPAAAARAPAPAPAARATANGGAAVLVDAPRRLYGDAETAAPSDRGGWLVVADMPPDADGRHGDPFSGEAGRLLDNMLRALQLHAGALPVHLMRTHRGTASDRGDGLHAFAERFPAQAEAMAPKVILAMGPLAAQSLLQSTDPLGRLRGRVVPLPALGGAAAVATYHPAYLLRNMPDKARAWADLCLAAAQVAT